jgi:hypothetical protein
MTARSLEEAIQESHAALGAISSGDVEPYMALYSDGDDITLGNPFGPFVRGTEAVRGAGQRAASRYRDGQVAGVRTGGDARGRRTGVRSRGRALPGEGGRQRHSRLDQPAGH